MHTPHRVQPALQVAERLGLLAELQRVAVLFVGLSFEGAGSKASATRRPGATSPTGCSPPPSASSRLGLGASTAPAAGGPVEDVSSGVVAANGGDDVGQDGVGGQDSEAPSMAVGAEKAAGAGGPAALSLELLQGSFSLLQSIVASHGGVIKELSVDDKGTVRGKRMNSGCRNTFEKNPRNQKWNLPAEPEICNNLHLVACTVSV